MKKRSIQDYIKRSFIKYSIIIILLILGIFLMSLYFIFNTSIVKPNVNLNQELQKVIENEFTFYKKELIKLSNDQEIKLTLQSGNQYNLLIQHLYDLKNQGEFNSNFILLNEKREIISNSYHSPAIEKISDSFSFHSIIDQLESESYIEQSVANILNTYLESMYYFGVSIKNQGKNIGYLLFFLEDLIVDIGYGQTIYITDEYNNVIVSTNKFGINHLGKLEIDTSKRLNVINEDFFYMNSNMAANQSINIVTMTPVNTYLLLLIYGAISMSVAGIITIIVVYIVSPKILRKTLEPFDILKSAISNENQDQVKNYEFNEFQTIYEEYNSKILEIQKLIQINKEITEKKRMIEIKHLEAKFNPHFLYNVLEMLKYEVSFDPENATNIIVKIAKLMRYNTNFDSTTIRLHIDIEYLSDYVSLQKMRYGDRLEYSERIEPSLLNVKTPKLIIQPLIENSIKHNIDHTNELSIQLIVKKVNQEIIIEVIDNGKGIEKSKLLEIEQMIINFDNMGNQNGLKNTHNIIQLLYGESFGLEINSTINVGTVVRLRIPFDEENSFA